MNDATMNFSGMQDNAQQIYTLATLLRLGDIFATGDETLLDSTATILQEKALELGRMIEAAQAVALDTPA